MNGQMNYLNYIACARKAVMQNQYNTDNDMPKLNTHIHNYYHQDGDLGSV